MDDVSKRVLELLYAGDREGAAEAAGAGPLDLFAASATGDVERLAVLLALDQSAATQHTDDGFTALHLAAFFGTPEAAAVLLRFGADPASVSENPMSVTPLHSAVAARSPEITALLLRAGAPVDARQAGGYTALHAAAQHGDADLVQLLLGHGADRSITDDDGKGAAAHAAEHGHHALATELSG